MNKQSKVKILPIGGLGEIGMNCMLIETAQTAILVDCGLMFSELDHFGVEFLIPNFQHVLAVKDKLQAMICTHGHEDHIGAVPFAVQAGLRCPIYASPFTSLMVKARLQDRGFESKSEVKTFNLGDTLEIGDFKIKTVSVNHSIVDSCALIIDTPAGKIVHTGDFKIDPSPYFGDVFAWDDFKKAGEDGVVLLLSDSTNIERHEHSLPEETIATRFDEMIASAKGLTLITMFSSNVGRLGVILDKARKHKKKVAVSGRSMEQNLRHAFERGCYDSASDVLVPIENIDEIPRNKLIVLASGCQGEPRSALNRIAFQEHPYVQVGPSDQVLFSSKFIPGNEVAISRLINELFRRGAEVMYESIDQIHTSGHATRPELKKMIEMVKPKHFIPVHGEYRMLVLHGDLAKECGVAPNRIHVIENGDPVSLTSSGLMVHERVEELRVFVEGREGMEVSKAMLRERRRMGEAGVVFVLVAREKDQGRILTKPSVYARGVIHENMEAWMQEEAEKSAQNAVKEYHEDLKQGIYTSDIAENLRLQVRRFFERNTGKKVTVVPLIIDV